MAKGKEIKECPDPVVILGIAKTCNVKVTFELNRF